MESIISKFFSEISYIAVIPFVVITIKNIIDNRNLTDIEKLLMTNWKKFKIDLSIYGVVNFVLLFIGFIYIATKETTSIIKTFPITTGLIAFAIVWLIFTMAFIVLFNALTWIERNLTCHQDFFITLEDEDWKIIKMKSETSMLVRKDNRYMFVDDWNNRVIFSKPKDSIPFIYKLCPNTKILNIVFLIILILSISGFILCFFINNLMLFPILFLSVFFTLTVAMVWSDHYLYSKFNNQKS